MKKIKLLSVFALLAGFGLSLISCDFDTSYDKLKKYTMSNGADYTLPFNQYGNNFQQEYPLSNFIGDDFVLPGDEITFTFDFYAEEDVKEIYAYIVERSNNWNVITNEAIISEGLEKGSVVHSEINLKVKETENIYQYLSDPSKNIKLVLGSSQNETSGSAKLKGFVKAEQKHAVELKEYKINWESDFNPNTGSYTYMHYNTMYPFSDFCSYEKKVKNGSEVRFYYFIETEDRFFEISANPISNAPEDSYWLVLANWYSVYDGYYTPKRYLEPGTKLSGSNTYSINTTANTNDLSRMGITLGQNMDDGEDGYNHPDCKKLKMYAKVFIDYNY